MSIIRDAYPSRQGTTAETLPRQDAIAYAPWHAHAPLTREQHAAFERDGFLVLRNIFDAEEVAGLKTEMASLLNDPSDLEDETVVREPKQDLVRSIFRIHAQNALFHRLAADGRISRIIRHLLDDDVYVYQSRLNYKPGFGGQEFYWHSDFETWHTEDGLPRMRTISASILLTDNSPLNGPLMLIPGSHRNFIQCRGETPENNYRTSLRKQEIGVPDQHTLTRLADEAGIVPATGKAGTVVLFDCNTLHGSNGNITPDPRSNAFFVYNAMSNQVTEPFAAASPRPHFLAERGNVTAVTPEQGRITRHRAMPKAA